MMAGVLLIAMGALRLGQLIRFIPISIVTGFTNGIAVIIGLAQLRDFLGLQVEHMPANLLSQIGVLWAARASLNWQALMLAAASLALIVIWP